ncbi:MAG: SPFH domain-containing protein [Acidobacteriota bacterium]
MSLRDTLFEKLRGEIVDIIEWIDDSQTTLVWRFPRYQNEIKHGAQLVVRAGQVAVFVHEGQIADVFEPGIHELTTRNLPILATILGWKYGFESPFKCEVYFVSTRQITGLKWGTPNPVMLRDADFGPIRLRAFGTYNLQAKDAKILIEQLVGTDGVFEAGEVTELMRSIIVSSFADVLGTSNIAALDLASNYNELAAAVRAEVVQRVATEFGLDVPQLFVVNISLPEEVEKALDTRSSMSVIGDMNQFQQYQMGQAMTKAAENPSGGGAAEGMGLGMGFAMANQMAQQMGQAQGGGAAPFGAPAAAPGTAPPPPPPAVTWFLAENGSTLGPFTAAQMQAMASQGRIGGQSLVWRAGMASWSPLSQIAELAGLTPPPPPPA